MQGRFPPLICRFCKNDLDEGDALQYFKEYALAHSLSDEWVQQTATAYGYSENTKVHHVKYHTRISDSIFYLQNSDKYITNEICPFCMGIFPLDNEKPREFLIYERGGNALVSSFRNGGIVTDSGATFSEDKKYRYELHRNWDSALDKIMFILLNPSTADETDDDHTTKRCIEFAKRFKYGGMYMVNLYAFRSTDPRALKTLPVEVAIGPENKRVIQELLGQVTKVVYAYGEKVKFVDPVIEPAWLKELVPEPYCFKKTKDGYPYHPRSIESSSELIPFREVTQQATQQTSEQAQVEQLRIVTPQTNTNNNNNPIEMPYTYPDLPASPDLSEAPTCLPCSIIIDDEISLKYPLPEGKSQKDLMRHIMKFFLDE